MPEKVKSATQESPMDRFQSIIAAPLVIPGTVVFSLLGFHLINVLQTLLANGVKAIRQSKIEVLDSLLKPPLAFVLNLLQSSFGSKFSPSATHVLLGAIIIIIVWRRI
jgi:hypothetical protein